MYVSYFPHSFYVEDNTRILFDFVTFYFDIPQSCCISRVYFFTLY